MAIGGRLYLIAKSTDKMFLPRLSVMLERRDARGVSRERWKRLAWVGAVCLAFMLGALLFGREILGLFGPEFVDGYAALYGMFSFVAARELRGLLASTEEVERSLEQEDEEEFPF